MIDIAYFKEFEENVCHSDYTVVGKCVREIINMR